MDEVKEMLKLEKEETKYFATKPHILMN